MQSIDVTEVKLHFEDILDRVEHGERVAITRNGRHIATILPALLEQNEVEMVVLRVLTRRERFQQEGRGLSLNDIQSGRIEGRK